MSDHDFQSAVLDRLARIETQQAMMYDQCRPRQEELEAVKTIAPAPRLSCYRGDGFIMYAL